MKSAMPFHGVPVPRARALVRQLTDGRAFGDREAFEAVVRTLWRGAKFREERDAALELRSRPAAWKLEALASLGLHEELIHTGAWWDLVDEVAAHRPGALLTLAAGPVKARLRVWRRGGDLWLRRAAIIAQLKHCDATDVDLLFEVIGPAVGEKAFFLRKAMGWALGALSRWKPDDVERWPREHEGRAAGLTVREARRASCAHGRRCGDLALVPATHRRPAPLIRGAPRLASPCASGAFSNAQGAGPAIGSESQEASPGRGHRRALPQPGVLRREAVHVRPPASPAAESPRARCVSASARRSATSSGNARSPFRRTTSASIVRPSERERRASRVNWIGPRSTWWR
jgi:3-methyladenine DNA glycosylase AlkD